MELMHAALIDSINIFEVVSMFVGRVNRVCVCSD